jgi:hypothetical protein
VEYCSLPAISKEFIRISGMTLVRTSPYYPQSNRLTIRTEFICCGGVRGFYGEFVVARVAKLVG